MTRRQTTEDVLREYFPEGVPLWDEVQIKQMATHPDVHHADEMVAAHERGARLERRRVLAILEQRLSKYRGLRKKALVNTTAWWQNAYKEMALYTFRGIMLRDVSEEEEGF